MDLREIALNKSQKRHPWELARIRVIKHFIRGLKKEYGKELTILDIGSGDSYLIKELSEEFKEASFYAVDINYDDAYLVKTNSEFASENRKIRVYQSLSAAEAEIQSKVNLILLLDVIEHVSDDVLLLSELAKSPRVDEKTNFLITVPAYQALFCSHDVFLGHYRRYNNTLLRKNISKAGLQVAESGYFFTSLLAPRFLQVFLEKKFTPEKEVTGIGNWDGNRLVSKVFENILYLDFKMSDLVKKLGVTLPGLSNYAVCKRLV
ncbi:class I SAM-dependent methyltransferase [Rufibacter latericius]|uniref:Class I SAM-dependent methyltransferase n=1 Tax=Rufibacter latericius TaxID=2487040 RepID=A0A3M9MWG1_9BACT|nr:class I SAM-dependent methyltransferase [Rufibacter latericius]RNI29233.1 class I SAM-dependent methyltransferase [Rufibacter latericius]